MRKLLFIVLAFTACLLFPEGGDGACIRQQAPSAAFSAGDMHTDEWQCERTYHSDLNHQPRVLREAESCPAQPSYRYGDRQVPAERAVVRGAAARYSMTAMRPPFPSPARPRWRRAGP